MHSALVSRSKELEDRKYQGGEQVSVLLPLPLNRAFAYKVPQGLTVYEGDFVRVGFGQRQVVGVIWGPSLEIIPANKKLIFQPNSKPIVMAVIGIMPNANSPDIP